MENFKNQLKIKAIKMEYKIGIDVGGTFTDFLLTSENGGSEVYKVLSTPEDPSIALSKFRYFLN